MPDKGRPFPQKGWGRFAPEIAIEEIPSIPAAKNVQDALEALSTGGGFWTGIEFANAVYVAKNGDDSDPAKPYLTVQAAVTACPDDGVIFVYPGIYDENVTCPDNKYIYGYTGSYIKPTTGTALTIVEGATPPATGSTLIAGVALASNEPGEYALAVEGSLRFPFAIVLNTPIDSYNGGNFVKLDQGGCYLSDNSGFGGDEAGRIGFDLFNGGQSIVNQSNLNFTEVCFNIRPGCAILSKGTRFNYNNTGADTPILVENDGGMCIMESPAISGNGNSDGLIRQTNNGNTVVYYPVPDFFNSHNGNIVEADSGMIRLIGGQYQAGGKGVVLTGNAQLQLGHSVELSTGDRTIDAADTSVVYATRAKIESFIGDSIVLDSTGYHFFDDCLIQSQNTTFDLRDGGASITGGTDLVSFGGSMICLVNSPGTSLQLGHYNIRNGVDNSINVSHLENTFARLRIGSNTSGKIDFEPVTSLPGNNTGYNTGSIVVWVNDGVGFPRPWINHGTAAVVNWQLLAQVTPVYGEIYQEDNVTQTAISILDQWATVGNFISGDSNGTNLDNIEVEVLSTGEYQVDCSISSSAISANKDFEFAITVNGTPQGKTKSARKFASLDTGSQSLNGILQLNNGDKVGLQVRNRTDTTNILVKHCNLLVHSIG